MYANTKLNAMPPQKPSHDFLGEMRSNNRFFPIADQTRKAPVSLIHIKAKNDKSSHGL